MLEIISWLIKVESLAHDVYLTLADIYHTNKDIHLFLTSLADDENQHKTFLQKAYQVISENSLKDKEEITLNEQTTIVIENQIKNIYTQLNSGKPSLNALFDFIARLEMSEWNEYFIYVINHLTLLDKDFQFMASSIQAHKKKIENFVSQFPQGRMALEKINYLTPLWITSILLIEESDITRRFLQSILQRESKVQAVKNLEEGIYFASHNHYDLIITDVDVPQMDSMDICNKIRHQIANNSRFLFLTDQHKLINWFHDNNLPLLLKPLNPEDFMDTIKTLKN